MTVPSLRRQLRNISTSNQGLQDILKSCSAGTEVISVSAIEAKVHNTKLVLMIDYGSNYPADQRYRERECYYRRVKLDEILTGISYPTTSLQDAIANLNLQGFDFTEDDLEFDSENILRAKETSLGYYNA